MEVAAECRGTPCLLAASTALPRESPISWVQRLCGDHQYSLHRMSEVSGIRPIAGDWDTGVSPSEWASLLTLTGIEQDCCGEAMHGLTLLNARFPRQSFLLCEESRPRYRWCSICLQTDPVPYLRWEWRLLGVSHCLTHRVPLESQCPWCGEALPVHRSLLVMTGSSMGVPDLATCGCCGMSLFDPEGDDDEAHVDSTDEPSRRLMEELLTDLQQAYASDERQLKLDLDPYANAVLGRRRVAPLQDPNSAGGNEHMWTDMCIRRLPIRQPPPFQLNGSEFVDGFAMTANADASRRKWSQLLRPADRLLLTKALQTIRAEKNALRRPPEAASAPSEAKGRV